MRHLLIFLLLLTNICANSAFAWDSHAEATAGDPAVTVAVSLFTTHDNSTNPLASEPQHSDHCSHSAAHLVGIFGEALVAQHQPLSRRYLPSSTFTLPNLRIAPLLRPPIV